jgi:4-hydroxybenzoate polyprenyltransferase
VARGAIRPHVAIGIAILLIASALLLSLLLANISTATILAIYLLLTFTYSATLKQRVILDVVVVATGFVLRAWGGTLAVGVPTSEWLVACVFTLCLFMGFGKRRCELAMISDLETAGKHRKTLLRYTPDLLNHLITVSAGIAIITFLLYTMDTAGHPAPFAKQQLFYTLPIVVYGVFRYAMLTELGTFAGPTEIVLKDRPLLGTILLWAAIALLIAYQYQLFGPAGVEGIFNELGPTATTVP